MHERAVERARNRRYARLVELFAPVQMDRYVSA
jgi:hypothetical protein